MSAAPAYSYYPERAFERAPERSPRTRINVVPGRKTQTPTLPASVVFLAKAVAVVLVVVSLVAFVRIGLAAATVTTSKESQALSSQIDEARSNGAALEVQQSSLANPTRVKKEASKLKMAAPETVGTINLGKDVVVTNDDGSLSLSKSVAAAAGIGA